MMRSTTARRSRSIAAPLLACLAGSAAAQPAAHTHTEDCGIGACAQARSLRTLFDDRRNPDGSSNDDNGGVFGSREAVLDTDVLHNNLDIEIIPATDVIAGSNTMTIRSKVNNLTEFTFMLRNNFTITQVRFNDAQNLAAPVFTGTYARRVTLPRPIALDEVFTLRIDYNGTAVSRGFGSIEFTNLGGQPAVFTLSEPYYAATWWPAKDAEVSTAGDLIDKATFDIAITAPAAMTVASNGLLQGIDTLSGNRRKHRWHTDYQMATYLAAFGAATYNTFSSTYTYPLPEGGNGTMPLNFFVSPSSDSQALRSVWTRSSEMMGAFRGAFGEYPFINEKYGIYEFTFGGGMEHQTMTGQSNSTSESLTAHELGHQWWGDNVTCRTWSDIWLNEGFATYSECVWQERRTGGSDKAALAAAINARTPGNLETGSVYRYDVSSANTIFSGTFAYNKGAWVLHALRRTVDGQLGEGAFFNLLQTYRAQYQGSSATTDDFAAVATSITGRNMQPFVDGWVYGQGTPIFASGFQRVTINGNDYLKLRVRQTQGAPASAFFPCGLDVRASTANGTQDSFVIPAAATSWHIIPLNIAGSVTGVTLDRNNWILNRGKTTEAYVQGPPKVLTASPTPGQAFPTGGAPAAITIGFSDNITASAANFAITRNGLPVPFTYAYNNATFVATLTPTAPLAGGTYTVTALDTVSANSGQRLDGEIFLVGNVGTLPSGDGAPLGTANISFTVDACSADFNQDGFLDFFDYDEFVSCFEGAGCGNGSSDFNQDGFTDFFDYDDYVAAFEAGC